MDDDLHNNLFLEKVLKDTGATIFKAGMGVEALEYCKEHPELSLVLMDGMMPQMTGYEATRKIREFNKEVPIVILTAYASVDSLRYAIDCGCTGMLSKPIGKEELVALFRKTEKEYKEHPGSVKTNKTTLTFNE